jgi:hypothetical protein
MIVRKKIYEEEVSTMNMVEYAKAAVEKMSAKLKKDAEQSTATSAGKIIPYEPIYSGIGNIWFVDWNHTTAKKNFIPIPMH